MAIKIFIDQGHSNGGINGGAEGNGLIEQNITFNVGKYLAEFLNNDTRFSAMTSRKTPDEVLGYNTSTSLAERVKMATQWQADYFISIHTNASENPEINGTEVYVYSENSKAYDLGKDILDSIVENIKTKDNGIRINKTFYVLRKTPMPACLIELAYITNYENALLLAEKQRLFAYAIYNGILNYFGYKKQ